MIRARGAPSATRAANAVSSDAEPARCTLPAITSSNGVVEHAQPARDAEHLVGERPAPAPPAAGCATSSPPRRHLEHERRELGADRAARRRLMPSKRLSRSGTPSARAERARERRLRARGLAHAGAGPECALDDVAGAAELAEALAPSCARSRPASLRPAATAPVPADETHPARPEMPARSAAKASLVMKRSPPSPRKSSAPARRTWSAGQSTPASAKTEAATSRRVRPASRKRVVDARARSHSRRRRGRRSPSSSSRRDRCRARARRPP